MEEERAPFRRGVTAGAHADSEAHQSSSAFTTRGKMFQSTRWRKQQDEERVTAFKEDLTLWLNAVMELDLSSFTLFPSLSSGVLLLKLAQTIEYVAANPTEQQRLNAARNKSNHALRSTTAKFGSVNIKVQDARSNPSAFVARDNIARFIQWCRVLGVASEVLFESNDLVESRNTKQVLYCLLEVCRFATRFGLEPSMLVSLEMEIEDELEGDSGSSSDVSRASLATVEWQSQDEQAEPRTPSYSLRLLSHDSLLHMRPVGLQGHKLSRERLSSSTSLDDEHDARHARLHGPKCWTSGLLRSLESIEEEASVPDWLQVDTGRIQFLTAIHTQGAPDAQEWVESFTLSTSVDGRTWQPVLNHGAPCTFAGNSDNGTVVVNAIHAIPFARFLRVFPVAFSGRASMRLEVVGQEHGHPLGLQSRSFPDGCFSASSVDELGHAAHQARLFNTASWSPAATDTDPFLQVDMQQIQILTAIILQGDEEWRDPLEAFVLETSLDGLEWNRYTAAVREVHSVGQDSFLELPPAVFENPSKTSTIAHPLALPQVCRFARINATKWHDKFGLRLELLVQSTGSPLGAESGTLPDKSFSSTSGHLGQCPPHAARLNHTSHWLPLLAALDSAPSTEPASVRASRQTSDATSLPILHVDLTHVVQLTAILFQGLAQGSRDRVTFCDISTSLDNKKWESQPSFHAQREDPFSTLGLALPFRTYCRFVKLQIREWVSAPALRLEFFGHTPGFPIGMQDGRLADSKISASSSVDDKHLAHHARLEHGQAWCPASESFADAFLQIAFPSIKLVRGIQTQGATDAPHWVSSYAMESSLDGRIWSAYRELGEVRGFVANADSTTIATNILEEPVHAKFLRIWPSEFTGAPALRCEVLVDSIGEPLGLTDGLLSDDHLTASSFHSDNHLASYARLEEKRGSRCWQAASQDTSAWLSVAFDEVRHVTAIALQGDRHSNAWLEAFSLQYSWDGHTWLTFDQSTHRLPLIERSNAVLEANQDADNISVLQFAPGFLARSVRLIPVAHHRAVCLRMELFGNDFGQPIGLHSSNAVVGEALRTDPFPLGLESTGRQSSLRLMNTDGSFTHALTSSPAAKASSLFIDLKELKVVSAVVSQGDPTKSQWVESFSMDVRLDEQSAWQSVCDASARPAVFRTSGSDLHLSVLHTPAVCRFVRLTPLSWVISPSWRCDILASACGTLAVPATQDDPLPSTQPSSPSGTGEFEGRIIKLSGLQRVHAVVLQGASGEVALAQDSAVFISLDGIRWFKAELVGPGRTGAADVGFLTQDSTRQADNAGYASLVLASPLLAKFVRIQPVSRAFGESLRFDVCSDSIGSEAGLRSGLLPDSHLTASSSLDHDHSASFARLEGPKFWLPEVTISSDSDDQTLTEQEQTDYLQIDLQELKLVTAIQTQGSGSGRLKDGQTGWVTRYAVDFSLNNVDWFSYTYNGKPVDFEGNHDGETAVSRILPTNSYPLVARYLRIWPTAWSVQPALRAEIVCQPCGQELGLSDAARVPASRLTASSSLSQDCDATQARLYNQDACWTPAEGSGHFIQIDMGRVRVLRGILAQGDPSGELGWVSSFTVQHSADNQHFSFLEAETERRVFRANFDTESIVPALLALPTPARYIRIFPHAWQLQPCLRLELLVEDVPGGPTADSLLAAAMKEFLLFVEALVSAVEANQGELEKVRAYMNATIEIVSSIRAKHAELVHTASETFQQDGVELFDIARQNVDDLLEVLGAEAPSAVLVEQLRRELETIFLSLDEDLEDVIQCLQRASGSTADLQTPLEKRIAHSRAEAARYKEHTKSALLETVDASKRVINASFAVQDALLDFAPQSETCQSTRGIVQASIQAVGTALRRRDGCASDLSLVGKSLQAVHGSALTEFSAALEARMKEEQATRAAHAALVKELRAKFELALKEASERKPSLPEPVAESPPTPEPTPEPAPEPLPAPVAEPEPEPVVEPEPEPQPEPVVLPEVVVIAETPAEVIPENDIFTFDFATTETLQASSLSLEVSWQRPTSFPKPGCYSWNCQDKSFYPCYSPTCDTHKHSAQRGSFMRLRRGSGARAPRKSLFPEPVPEPAPAPSPRPVNPIAKKEKPAVKAKISTRWDSLDTPSSPRAPTARPKAAKPAAKKKVEPPPRPPSPPKSQKESDDDVHDAVLSAMNECTCSKQIKLVRLSRGRYRIENSDRIIFIRLMRDFVMVRIGGGWDTLGSFLTKIDPCRLKHAGDEKGPRGGRRNVDGQIVSPFLLGPDTIEDNFRKVSSSTGKVLELQRPK
eukprot:m.908496 g.908496  ORF g.908496 m.908496 type:complete len:2276 (+) comp60102_c0_seq5:98-6925(+)